MTSTKKLLDSSSNASNAQTDRSLEHWLGHGMPPAHSLNDTQKSLIS